MIPRIPVDILLVEDNESDAELAMRVLRVNHPAQSVHLAKDGVEAILFLRRMESEVLRGAESVPRIVILDLKLPKANGLDVLRIVKENALLRTIPVVIFSSSRESLDIREALRLGANSYVVKPVRFEEYSRAITAIGRYWLTLHQT